MQYKIANAALVILMWFSTSTRTRTHHKAWRCWRRNLDPATIMRIATLSSPTGTSRTRSIKRTYRCSLSKIVFFRFNTTRNAHSQSHNSWRSSTAQYFLLYSAKQSQPLTFQRHRAWKYFTQYCLPHQAKKLKKLQVCLEHPWHCYFHLRGCSWRHRWAALWVWGSESRPK